MRALAVLAIAISLMAGLCGCKTQAVSSDDMSLGNPNAKVTVIEYASLGCPHCAHWNNEVFPAFKAKYIDTGKVRYVLREFLTGDPGIASAGFLLARCAGKDKYFQVVDAVFHEEADLLESQDNGAKRDRLVRIAESAGLTEPQFQACITDDKALTALNDRSERYGKQNNISGTPTFVINGKVYSESPLSIQDLDKAIAEAQAGAK
ncbi:MAG: DsbA family protein [Caulobacteraceae bacterium]|nr:DsbA family protein [Caulobacteraceae bacterium]